MFSSPGLARDVDCAIRERALNPGTFCFSIAGKDRPTGLSRLEEDANGTVDAGGGGDIVLILVALLVLLFMLLSLSCMGIESTMLP